MRKQGDEYACEAQAVPWVRATQAGMRRSLMHACLRAEHACAGRTSTTAIGLSE